MYDGRYDFESERECYQHILLEEEQRFKDQSNELKGSGVSKMGLVIHDTGGGDFDPAPSGNHIARCVRIIDLGTHDNEYQGKVTKKHEIFFMWELPHEEKTYEKDGKEITEPFTISKFYTASLSSKSHTRADLESWRGRAFTDEELQGFDIQNVLGKPCMLNVIHKEKQGGGISARVQGVSQMPKGLECPEPTHPLIFFSLDDFTEEKLNELSEGLQRRIRSSDEYRAMSGGSQSSGGAVDERNPPTEFDDIPF